MGSGFLFGTLIVPRFVLQELQHIADHPDANKRNRGRRGLEILSTLQKDERLPVEITDQDFPEIDEVDAKLVALAKARDAAILTNDFNLNRVADLQGIRVLNVNHLANAVKPAFLPGEELRIRVIQEGKEAGQGVGFLDDGTMIVVEGGARFLDRDLDVTVTRVLQTVAGRMVFAHPRLRLMSPHAARRLCRCRHRGRRGQPADGPGQAPRAAAWAAAPGVGPGGPGGARRRCGASSWSWRRSASPRWRPGRGCRRPAPAWWPAGRGARRRWRPAWRRRTPRSSSSTMGPGRS